MLYVPNIYFREAVAFGTAAIRGLLDPSAPGSTLKPLFTPGTIDLGSLFSFNDAHQKNAGRNHQPTQAAAKAAEAVKKTQPVAHPPPTQSAPGGIYTLPTSSTEHAGDVTDAEYQDAANQIGLTDAAAIRAIAQVESHGQWFLKDGRPVVRYEPHHFRLLSGKRFDKSHPDLSAPYSVVKAKHLSKGNKAGYLALEQAILLDSDAAVQACSWGAFQVMGDNWKAAGFSSPHDMLLKVYQSKDAHLRLFVSFVKTNHLAALLKNRQWKAFADRYNGSDNAVHHYDVQLADNYRLAGGAL